MLYLDTFRAVTPTKRRFTEAYFELHSQVQSLLKRSADDLLYQEEYWCFFTYKQK